MNAQQLDYVNNHLDWDVSDEHFELVCLYYRREHGLDINPVLVELGLKNFPDDLELAINLIDGYLTLPLVQEDDDSEEEITYEVVTE